MPRLKIEFQDPSINIQLEAKPKGHGPGDRFAIIIEDESASVTVRMRDVELERFALTLLDVHRVATK